MAVWSVPERFNFPRDVVERTTGPAITFVDREGRVCRWTFAEVATRTAQWARLLRRHGVARGERVLVLVGKTPEWHPLVLAVLKLGAVAIPCSEMLRARDLSFRARHSGAVLLVADRAAEGEVAAMDARPDVVYVDEADLAEESRETADTAASDAAFILYTSGTTKEPKGAVHTHAYTFAKRMQAERWLNARSGDLVWCTASTGWAKSIWNVRHAVSAGEPLNPEVIKAFRDAFGLTVYDGYGQTENTLLVGNFPGMEIRPGSMGVPSPGHEIGVIDEDGAELPPGEEGDLALRGRPPSLFVEYYRAPEETAAVFRGDWYVTGDRATRDEDGYLWFTGRADDVILSAAYRIGPFEVESALLEHAAVAESAVVGKPHPDRGQIVKAFVVLRPGFAAGDELVRDLQEHARRVTAPYKYPREIEFVDSLPKTRSGKIRRVELRKLEEERALA